MRGRRCCSRQSPSPITQSASLGRFVSGCVARVDRPGGGMKTTSRVTGNPQIFRGLSCRAPPRPALLIIRIPPTRQHGSLSEAFVPIQSTLPSPRGGGRGSLSWSALPFERIHSSGGAGAIYSMMLWSSG